MSTTGHTRPAEGLFAAPRPMRAIADMFANVWQLGYVTTDLERGLEELGNKLGLEHHVIAPTGGASFIKDGVETPWDVRIAMAARGGLIVELIEPVGGEVGYYRDALPSDGSFAVRLHHLATLLEPGDEAWGQTEELLHSAGLKYDYTVLIPDRARLGYVDMRAELGHWVELCQLHRADTDFFTQLVGESA